MRVVLSAVSIALFVVSLAYMSAVDQLTAANDYMRAELLMQEKQINDLREGCKGSGAVTASLAF